MSRGNINALEVGDSDMKTFCSLILLVLGFGALFVYIGNSVPQAKVEKGGEVTITLTPEGLIEAGEKIFTMENACLTCHSLGPDPKARCPDQEAFESRATWEKAGLSPAAYLMESVYIPTAYTVEGFPKGQMKPINGPPMALDDGQILAVTAFLYNKAKPLDENVIKELMDAQEKYKKAAPPVEATASFELPEEVNPEDGMDVFDAMKCWECHGGVKGFEDKVVEGGGKVGPDISNIAAIQDAQYLYESIVFPNKVIVKGEGFTGEDGKTKMPEFHDTLTIRQLYDLIAFMQTLK